MLWEGRKKKVFWEGEIEKKLITERGRGEDIDFYFSCKRWKGRGGLQHTALSLLSLYRREERQIIRLSSKPSPVAGLGVFEDSQGSCTVLACNKITNNLFKIPCFCMGLGPATLQSG